MRKLLNTLYVSSQGSYLRKEGETIVVEREQEKVLQLPAHTIGSVVCFGNVLCSPFLLGASQMAKNLNLDRGRSKGHVGTYTTQMYGISSNKTASFRQTFSRMPCPSHVAFPWRPEGGWVCEWLRPKYGASPGLLKGADGIQVVCTRGPDGDGVPH